MNLFQKEKAIKYAIDNGRWLKIDYVDRKLKITKDRLIQPLEIRYLDKLPFSVMSHCLLRNEPRDFQFEGIQKIKLVKPTENYGKDNINSKSS